MSDGAAAHRNGEREKIKYEGKDDNEKGKGKALRAQAFMKINGSSQRKF